MAQRFTAGQVLNAIKY